MITEFEAIQVYMLESTGTYSISVDSQKALKWDICEDSTQKEIISDQSLRFKLDPYAHSFKFSKYEGGGRVVRWRWVNFQCSGVLQF